MLTNDNITINRNTRYDDIDISLYSEYGCNNQKEYKIYNFKWGSVFSIYDSEESFSSIQIKYEYY